MDSNKIKNLATGVRDALRAEASARLDAVLAEGSCERLESTQRVRAIEGDMAEHGRDEVADRAAYTWFNRLCALRFMDANGYTPTPVVTPREGQTQPAILADAAQGVFDPDYEISPDARRRVTGLLAGSVASANAAEDAYATLLQEVCGRYAGPMGYLFAEDVASSLLMPRGLLAQGSVLSRIVEGMDVEACSSVEVLGWLYQFYIAERKDEYFASRRKATAADIPAATQLFTPRWIVAFLAENSLGRLWMLNNPESELAGSMDYYVAPEGDEPHAEVASADEIRVLDPACGSGHILVYAFDLLFRMYEEEGWPTEDISQMILGNNLFGLEIDRRAAEIASFALEMKARERDPRWFEKGVDAQIRVLEPVELLPQELELVPQLAERHGLLEAMSHLDEVGSLYIPDPQDEFVLRNALEHIEHDGSLFAESAISKLRIMLANVKALGQSYHCVIANPPYMGSANMNPWLNGWIRDHFPDEKYDLCTCFIKRGLLFTRQSGFSSLITMQSWMFISSFAALRKKLFNNAPVITMAHLGTRAFDAIGGEVVSTTATVFSNASRPSSRASFIRLVDIAGGSNKDSALRRVISRQDSSRLFVTGLQRLEAIPNMPFAYWISPAMEDSFRTSGSIGNCGATSIGIKTGNNKLFLRLWWEVGSKSIGFGFSSFEEALKQSPRWVPCNKGGSYRKWYGNEEYVIDFREGGELIFKSARELNHASQDYQQGLKFVPYVSWSDISSDGPSFRYRSNEISDHTGMGFYPSDGNPSAYLGFLNSTVASRFLEVLAPTIHLNIGELERVPLRNECLSEAINQLANDCISLARSDWDSFETSWDFFRHPMAYVNSEGPTLIADAYARWEAECRGRFERLKANEEELNRIFARIYHMEGEVPIEVPDDRVSVRLADRGRDARSLVSYIVGCIFGRYSWECGALVIANQGDTVEDYCSWSRVAGEDLFFVPDYDNVLPVLADEWFDDDIVFGVRRWLAHAYGEEALEENVAWLEKSLGKDLRSYLMRDFYADHLRVYQRRPIYWMFQSPKKSFQCLVYMHRYDEGTVGTILTSYLRPLEDKLRARLRVLESPGASAADAREANRVRGQIAELEQWEREVVYPLAHERVSIDLDDGVKVNYNKFPKALAKVPGLSEWK